MTVGREGVICPHPSVASRVSKLYVQCMTRKFEGCVYDMMLTDVQLLMCFVTQNGHHHESAFLGFDARQVPEKQQSWLGIS